MAIPNGDGVDGATIHAKAKSVVVLGYQDDGYGTRTQALADVSHGKKFLYLPLDFLCFFRGWCGMGRGLEAVRRGQGRCDARCRVEEVVPVARLEGTHRQSPSKETTKNEEGL